MAFSRGLHTGWFGGINNQELVHGRFGKKRGVYLGAVECVARDRVRIRLEGPIKPGDGVVFDAGKPEEQEEGGRVYEIQRRTRERGLPRLSKWCLAAGTWTFRGCAPATRFGRRAIRSWTAGCAGVLKGTRRSFNARYSWKRTVGWRTAHASRPGRAGKPGAGGVAMPLVRAEKQPLTTQRLREQLGRLGGTPFKLGGLKNWLPDDVMLPVSELNRLRRRAVAELERSRLQPKRWRLVESPLDQHTPGRDALPPVQAGRQAGPARPDERAGGGGAATLIVLVRSLAQLQAALDGGIQTVYCDFEDPKKYRDAMAVFRAARPPSGSRSRRCSWLRRESSRPARTGRWIRSVPAARTAISFAITIT